MIGHDVHHCSGDALKAAPAFGPNDEEMSSPSGATRNTSAAMRRQNKTAAYATDTFIAHSTTQPGAVSYWIFGAFFYSKGEMSNVGRRPTWQCNARKKSRRN